MATQGILSVVDKNGKVRFKVVCGCNGSNIQALANVVKQVLKEDKSLTATQLYSMADDQSCGCSVCLVVMGRKDVLYRGIGKLSKLYRKTFGQPTFNPRWECGFAPYTIVVKEKKERSKHVD